MDLLFRPHVDLAPRLGARAIAAVGIGADGSVAALVAEEALAEGSGATATAILLAGADGVAEIRAQPFHVSAPLIQPTDRGALVAECRVAPNEGPNARIFGPDGTVLRRLMLGDGIEHLLVDRSGDAWVGYFDEGVYGSLGWGEPDGPRPVGSHGLNRFDLETGALAWTFSPPANGDVIDDCYALNVDEAATWVYYYRDFALVRIDADGGMRRWTTSTAGARSVVTDGSAALLIGSFADPQAAVLWGLAERALVRPRPVRLSLPDGRAPSGPLIGRGATVYAAEGPLVLRADIAGIAADPAAAQVEPISARGSGSAGRPGGTGSRR